MTVICAKHILKMKILSISNSSRQVYQTFGTVLICQQSSMCQIRMFFLNRVCEYRFPRMIHVCIIVITNTIIASSTAAEGSNCRGSLAGGKTFVHVSRIVPRGS